MQTNLKILIAATMLTGCATMGGTTPVQAVGHQTPLPADAKAGVKVAAGPLTLEQAQLVPAQGATGSALLWTSSDASCPPVSKEGALASLTPQQAYYGPQQVGQGQYLCAQQVSGGQQATLDWFTAK